MDGYGSASRKLLSIVGSLAVVMVGCVASTGPLRAQTGPACVLKKTTYTCNLASFRGVWAAAKTVAVRVPPRDSYPDEALRKMILTMGKTVVAPEEGADITFVLTRVDLGGIEVGPADVDLATLRVYGPSSPGDKGPLVWSETYRGQADRPWQMIVNSVLQQFQDRLAGSSCYVMSMQSP